MIAWHVKGMGPFSGSGVPNQAPESMTFASSQIPGRAQTTGQPLPQPPSSVRRLSGVRGHRTTLHPCPGRRRPPEAGVHRPQRERHPPEERLLGPSGRPVFQHRELRIGRRWWHAGRLRQGQPGVRGSPAERSVSSPASGLRRGTGRPATPTQEPPHLRPGARPRPDPFTRSR